MVSLRKPLIDSPEGYEEDLDPHTVGIEAAGFYPQNATSSDMNAGVERDVSGNLVLKDALAGSTTLAALLSAAGVSEYDLLLVADPAKTSSNYTVTYVSSRVTNETWRRLDNTLWKTTDYTYSSGRVATEVSKIWNAAGNTVMAQLTITYSYTGSIITSATYVRNI